VKVEKLTKAFGGHPVLHSIDLEVTPGTTTCIIGPSGSGKSTLLRCINLLESPTSGRIVIGDDEITAPSADLDAIRSRVGMVFQNFNLFPHMSVLRNVTLALMRVRKLTAEAAVSIAERQLSEVGLLNLKDRRPTQLSGGQQQRVGVARARAMQPDVILFDEATSALDPELVKGVLEIMKRLAASGMTMLVVTHELRFAREAANQVVFLDQGKLIESGPPGAVFGAPKASRLQEFLSQML
jgi:polar amino acid transport system ATP-binding protein